MDMISSVQNFETARSSAEIQYAVAAKIMKTTSQLQEDLVSQLLGKSGIGNNLNVQGNEGLIIKKGRVEYFHL